MKKAAVIAAAATLFTSLVTASPALVHARAGEFRGAWLHTVSQQKRFAGKNAAQLKSYFTAAVDSLQAAGINTVIFQVRPEGDAFYRSRHEPWSRYLTGEQGKAPEGGFDPLEFMIKLCHARKMELHAWINPYRMTVDKNERLCASHLYHRHPERFVTYDGRIYLDPGLPENREWIRMIARDIVSRYEVDGIHIDDYFYPYPVKGLSFGDDRSFAKYARRLGVTDRGDFRRKSVDLLVKGLHDDLRALKPKVRFGVSPFGIYRNRKNWSAGSNTDGLQCYDDLYADVLKWAGAGWIDYLVPQLYWEIGHSRADYQHLCNWWASHVPANCRLYIGQSIERSMEGDQFVKKLNQARKLKKIAGQCFWYGWLIVENDFHIREFLKRL